MPANTPDQWQLTELNHKIEQLQADAAQLDAARVANSRTAVREARRGRYLRVARWVRSPSASLELWSVGLLTIGPIAIGFLFLVILSIVTGSFAAGLVAFLVGAAAGAVLLATLLHRPPDALLPAAMEEADAGRRLAEARLNETVEQLAAVKDQYAKAVEQRRDLMASGQVQRAALLQREWKAMPEIEWEDFVVEVCRTLGASVDRTPSTTEKDANLLAQFGDRKVALVTRGEGHTVNSNAVGYALAGKQRHRCDHCAVIINRRFTGAAQDFARHNGCTAIGVEEFPDFVMGKISLGS